ncbi:MAG: hemerythrin domain-containing protein [Terriglobales bacterium]
MLRDPSLIPLSRQHQHALALCVQIQRALRAGSVDLSSWQSEIQRHFSDEVRFHFAAEEQVLFPAARRFPELAALADELTSDHARLRIYFANSEQGGMDHQELEAFATALSTHIRKEERQLFEGLQQRLQPEELTSLGTELQLALEDAVQACRLKPGASS